MIGFKLRYLLINTILLLLFFRVSTAFAVTSTPTVTLTSPANNLTCILGKPITITATGTNCHHMNAFVNGTAVGNTILGNNYSFNYTPTQAGTYTICVKGRNTASATDAETQLIVSSIITVNVVAHGDMDGNQIIDTNDYSALKNYILMSYPDQSYNALDQVADMDEDGKVSSKDLALLKRYLLTIGAQFPESYGTGLVTLYCKHPSWIFSKYDTDVDWNIFISQEDIRGRCQVNYPNVPENWVEANSQEYYPGWKAAATDVIKYYGDPRNFLNERDVFQFQKLSYDPTTDKNEGIIAILTGTFMENSTYAQYFMEAAAKSGASPYFLASKARQEMGVNGCSLSNGTVSGYEGYYNFYNIGASGTSPEVNGAIYAKEHGWNSTQAAIIGGAEFCLNNYISVGQDTTYAFKFDLVGSEMFTHQFEEDVQAGLIEGQKFYNGYNAANTLNAPFIFKIPVFVNMPAAPCPRP